MAWIEVHQSLARHPKTKKAARALQVSTPAMLGHLVCLWCWCLEYAERGDLGGFTNEDIADAAMWDGDPDRLIEALLNSKFLEVTPQDDALHVHDWTDYAGKLIERREKNANRMKSTRATKEQNTCKTRATHVQDTCGATVPNPTVPNLKEEDMREGDQETDHPLPGKSIPKCFDSYCWLVSYPQLKEILDEQENPPPLLKDKPETWTEWICLAIKETCDRGHRNMAYLRQVISSARDEQRAPGTKKTTAIAAIDRKKQAQIDFFNPNNCTA